MDPLFPYPLSLILHSAFCTLHSLPFSLIPNSAFYSSLRPYQFIVYQICNISREVVNALPYGYNISLQFGYPLYMRRRHRNVTEGNTSHAKRTSSCQALHGTKSCFVSTKSNARPYGSRPAIILHLACSGGRQGLGCRLGRCFCFAEVSTGHPHPSPTRG